MRVSFFLFLFHLIAKQIIWNIVLYMIFMMMRKNVLIFFFILILVLYPLLEPGDRVKCGPDWQWGDQNGGCEGTVVRRKDWKGLKDKGVIDYF